MKRILIVDDNTVVQDILRQFFEPRYKVQMANNASQALASIIKSADGVSLLKSLREMGVAVPVFVMTGYDSLQVAQDALNSGANGYLPKPFDLMHLDRLVSEAVGVEALQAT